MDIVAIIPARGGSKGLVGKNIKLLHNKPLIAYTIEAALQSKNISRVIVTTDDLEIATISKAYGAEVPFLREVQLATDTASIIDVIKDCLGYLEKESGSTPEYICLLQCTSPLRLAQDIDGAIEKCIQTQADGCMSVTEVEDHPYWMHQFTGDRIEYVIPEGAHIARRQDLPPFYKLNGAIYLAKTKCFLEQNKIEVDDATGYIMPKERSIDIDTYLDFKMAETILDHKRSEYY